MKFQCFMPSTHPSTTIHRHEGIISGDRNIAEAAADKHAPL
jgi:hypothetical protein